MTTKYKSLQEENPQLALEWHPTKNNNLTPSDVSLMSRKKVWWICKNGHEWDMIISARSGQKQGCPFCANKRACKDNCLATIYPELSKEWDYSKNVDLTPFDVLPHSNKKVWWLCPNGHSFYAWISDRVNGASHCTQCSGYTIRDRDTINTIDGYRICKNCKKELPLDYFRLKYDKRSNKDFIDNICKQCSSDKVGEYRKTDRGIAAEVVRRTKYVSKSNNLPFDLDNQWVLDRLNQIEWCCELTKIPFNKIKYGDEHLHTGFQWNALSIDKIIPSLGYVKSNVRFVLNQINVFKQDGTDERMFMLAEILLKNRKVNE